MQVERHADGQHLVLRSSWACAAPVQVAQLDYRLFARTDPSHRGLLNIAVAETAGQPASDGQAAVLIAGEGERSWVLAQAGFVLLLADLEWLGSREVRREAPQAPGVSVAR